MRLADKYKWVVDAVRLRFPCLTIRTMETNYGAGFRMSTSLNEIHHGWILEDFATVGGTEQTMTNEDGEEFIGIGPPFENKAIGFMTRQADQQDALLNLLTRIGEAHKLTANVELRGEAKATLLRSPSRTTG